MKDIIENLVKQLAIALYLGEAKERFGLISQDELIGIRDNDAHTSLERMIGDYLPIVDSFKAKINGIDTDSFPVKRGSYYPEHSFYHLGLCYSGMIDNKHYYMGLTIHWDKDMKFIDVQYHQTVEGWTDELKEQIKLLFK